MERRDPFMDDLAAFKPEGGRVKPDRKDIREAAQDAGFNDRSVKPIKEKTESLPIKLKSSEVQRFRKQAIEEFGHEDGSYGAFVAYFRKMWKFYEEHQEAKD
jgi:hypothetical protein